MTYLKKFSSNTLLGAWILFNAFSKPATLHHREPLPKHLLKKIMIASVVLQHPSQSMYLHLLQYTLIHLLRHNVQNFFSNSEVKSYVEISALNAS